ncbi:solute carrier family 25 member 45-like isoform X2 [Babylonia areolata]|uniref:solute carrier family 25 member 45-like isoform X2 n=1 Tax=Babylonia areolata TaxID=304850 RepID=UPI003FD0760D
MEAHTSTHWVIDYLAGAVGGMVGMVVGHPFDTTKVQMQTQEGAARYKGTLDAMTSIKHHGLLRGFFRGLSYPLVSYGGVNAIIFGVYGASLRMVAEDRTPGLWDVFVAGCAGGAAQLVLACPVDVVKCRLQAQIPHEGVKTAAGHQEYFTGPTQCTRAVWRQSGLRGMYRGLGTMALRDVPTYGIYLVLYEIISSALHARGLTDSRGIVADVIGGGLAGSMSWFCAMPFDVIKSRLQADSAGRYRGFLHCWSVAVKQEGLPVLYRGTLVTCLRGFPVNAATFMVYTQLLKHLKTYDSESQTTGA